MKKELWQVRELDINQQRYVIRIVDNAFSEDHPIKNLVDNKVISLIRKKLRD